MPRSLRSRDALICAFSLVPKKIAVSAHLRSYDALHDMQLGHAFAIPSVVNELLELLGRHVQQTSDGSVKGGDGLGPRADTTWNRLLRSDALLILTSSCSSRTSRVSG